MSSVALRAIKDLQAFCTSRKDDKDKIRFAPPYFGENILKEIAPNYHFLEYKWLGGESLSLTAVNKLTDEVFFYKIALPQFDAPGKRIVRQYVDIAKNDKDFDVQTENKMRQRFIMGAKLQKEIAQIQSISNRGVVPKIYDIVEVVRLFRQKKSQKDFAPMEDMDNPSLYDCLEVPLLHIKMEKIEAAPLSAWVQIHSHTQALNFLLGLLEFFGEIHAFGIVHRDIQPDNIMVKGCFPVVVDWTIAKVYTNERDITADGYGMGTMLYRSEQMQFDSRNASPQDDIYSCGIVMSYLINKTDPRLYPNEDLRIPKHREKYLNRIKDGLPPSVQETFQKATDMDVSRRFHLAREFIESLKIAMIKEQIEIFPYDKFKLNGLWENEDLVKTKPDNANAAAQPRTKIDTSIIEQEIFDLPNGDFLLKFVKAVWQAQKIKGE